MGYLSEEVPIHHPLHHPSRPVSQPSDLVCIVVHHLTNHQVSIKYRYLYKQPIGMLVIHAVCNESIMNQAAAQRSLLLTENTAGEFSRNGHRGMSVHIVLIPVCCESNFNL